MRRITPVEIPEEAIAKGAERLWLFRTPIAKTRESCTEQAREVIAAALPYLAPAAEEPTENTGVASLRDAARVSPSVFEKAAPYLSPAGDGGLREALGKAWDDGNAVGLDGYVGPGRGAGDVDPEAERARDRILDKLAEYLAAPAVPQPVDREALREQVADAVQVAVFGTIDHAMYGEREHCDEITKAVLAVLAGEQEQVEK